MGEGAATIQCELGAYEVQIEKLGYEVVGEEWEMREEHIGWRRSV